MATNIEETFEKLVFNFIAKYLSEDEHIAFGGEFDFVLPYGLKKLGWPPKTAVEIKCRLIYDSFSRIRSSYDNVKPNKLIVVVMDDDFTSRKVKTNIPLAGIEFISYLGLLNMAPVNSIENTKTKKEENNKAINDDIIIEKAKDALKSKKISLFLGAGVSASAGVVTWDSLLEQLRIKRRLPKINKDIDSIVKGRCIIDGYKELGKEIPAEFYHDMRGILYANIRSSKLIESIAKLITKSNIESIISYNYDNLVEQEVEKKKKCYPIYDKSRLDDNSLCIYHVHGYIPPKNDEDWSPIVLGEKEYHKIYQESYNWGNVEQLHALCRSVCFFIGLSMTDPNLRRLIDISIDGSEIESVHYAFLRKTEHNVSFMEKTLYGFGINCIWYDEHDELPGLLDSLMN